MPHCPFELGGQPQPGFVFCSDCQRVLLLCILALPVLISTSLKTRQLSLGALLFWKTLYRSMKESFNSAKQRSIYSVLSAHLSTIFCLPFKAVNVSGLRFWNPTLLYRHSAQKSSDSLCMLPQQVSRHHLNEVAAVSLVGSIKLPLRLAIAHHHNDIINIKISQVSRGVI